MVDISKCCNQSCPKKGSCYRAQVKGNDRQTVTPFELNDDGECDFFLPYIGVTKSKDDVLYLKDGTN